MSNSGRNIRAALAIGLFGALAIPAWTAMPVPVTPPPADKPQDIRPVIPTADRYQQGKVFLEHADVWRYQEQPDVEPEDQYQVLVGDVVFRKNDMYMYCDSAHFYETSNSFDAFSNVRMEQGDTLFVYADELNYDGATELAVLYADAGKKVRLINRDVQLSTDVFNYDMPGEVGYYEVGGTLTDASNTLESLEGEYHPNTKEAYFHFDVRLNSVNGADTLRLFSDSLNYNTTTHVATLVSPTQIINADGTIYSSSGNYNTDTGIADLYSRSLVVTNRGNTLTGDTLFYDRAAGIGEAFGNMVLTDSARQSSLHGDYGFYNELADSAFVTGRALAKEYSKRDTLYLHGDTIYAYLDRSDSTRVTNVYHRVRFYRSDMQGLCDSLSTTERDSMLYMYRHPVVWTGDRQVFGNVIHVHFNDSAPEWAKLPEFGFMAEHLGEDCYQQIAGNEMTAWFNDSTLRRLYVEGNVQLIMFPLENDSTVNKYAYVESSIMDSWYVNNDIEKITFTPATTAKVVPLYLAKKGSYFLQQFKWHGDIRPTSPEDVFNIPQAMIDLINTTPQAPPVKAKAPEPRKPAPRKPGADRADATDGEKAAEKESSTSAADTTDTDSTKNADSTGDADSTKNADSTGDTDGTGENA